MNEIEQEKAAEQMIRLGIGFLKSVARRWGWVLHVRLEKNPPPKETIQARYIKRF